MPFTLAHPAVVIPLHKRLAGYLSLSALIIGSVMPDFAYFLPMQVTGFYSHSLVGLIGFCLPAGILIYYTFHLVMKRPLTRLLPLRLENLANQSTTTTSFSSRTLLIVSISLLIGALTHIIWDSFTHYFMWPVQNIPLLRTELVAIGNYHVYLYRLIQHVSTLLGITYLTWLLINLNRHADNKNLHGNTLPLQGKVLLILFFILAGVIHSEILVRFSLLQSLQSQVFTVVTQGISGMLYAMLAYSVLWHGICFWRKRSNQVNGH